MTDRLEQIKKNQTSPYSSNADCIYLLYELAALRAERDYWKNECAEQDRARTQMAHNSIEKDNRLAALRAENERLRARIDSLRDGLVEIAAGDPDVTPAGLPTSLRSRAKATLDIDDEAALHPQEAAQE